MNRKATNRLRIALDELLPPVLRESFVFRFAVRRWLGSRYVIDFKEKAFAMSDAEFTGAYAALQGAYAKRSSDTTEAQMSWITEKVSPKQRVLEIGPGNGTLTRHLLSAGTDVCTLDLSPNADPLLRRFGSVGAAEKMPFSDKSFDVTIAAHVIEHVRSLTRTFLELQRVTRKTVLIVCPRQRFYRVTFDYHLHFFYSLAHLASFCPNGTATGNIVDNDLCLEWTLAD